MIDILEKIAVVLLGFVFVPCLIGVFIITMLIYIAAIEWVWTALQVWWMT